MKYYRPKTTKAKKGFTLIELIIVIAIIGILTALIMPNFMAGRIRARDSAKKADLRSLKQALQMYYNDYQTYPASFNGLYIMGCGVDGTSSCNSKTFKTEPPNQVIYMKTIPGTEMRYHKDASSDSYILQIELENESDEDIATSRSNCSQACTDNNSPCCAPTAGENYYCVCPD